jgi:CYTH domain-containing protein
VGTKEEIERKFLVEEVPDLKGLPFYNIRQGYLDHKRLRRRSGDSKVEYFLTVKKGRGMIRKEEEREITRREFYQYWKETEGRRLKKRRYLIKSGRHTIELDIFGGALKGLVLVEVEFKTATAARHFIPPIWFGAEVTDDLDYTNRNLATYGLKFLRKENLRAA